MASLLPAIVLSLAVVANGTPTDKSPPKPKSEASEQKYCITFEPPTESRISKRECLTKSQWAEQGVNVDDVQKGAHK